MQVVPLDPSPVRGSHGRLPEDPEFAPVLLCDDASVARDRLAATEVRDLILELLGRYAPDARRLPSAVTRRPVEPEDLLDEWAACGIGRPEDIRARFADRFWFGCEADDRTTAFAFSPANEFGASLRAVLSSDISHWDVVGAIHSELFGDIRPVATMVEVSALISPDLLVEIEVDAYVSEG